MTLFGLAMVYQDQHRYAEAEPLFKRVLAIEEKAEGPRSPDGLIIILNGLAQVYNAQGRYAEAEPLLKRALAIREKDLNPQHPRVAENLNDLATLYYAQGRFTEAEQLLKRAMGIQVNAFGPQPPTGVLILWNLAGTFRSLALLYETHGRYADAEPLFKQAVSIQEKELAILEKALGPKNIYMVKRLEPYAALLQKTGRDAEADKILARAKAIRAAHTKGNPTK